MAIKHPWSHAPCRVSLKRTKGFTLIELIVVTGILIIISALILANNREFGGRILLENLAYDVALSIRQAQVYGISVRQFETGTFEIGYGMHFDVSSRQAYNLFGDLDLNGLWCDEGDCEPEDVSPSPYSIERGYYIDRLCAPAGEDPETCETMTRVDVIFKRPEPDACISTNGNSAITGEYKCTPGAEHSVRIVLKSPRGDESSVIVEASGQISVIE